MGCAVTAGFSVRAWATRASCITYFLCTLAWRGVARRSRRARRPGSQTQDSARHSRERQRGRKSCGHYHSHIRMPAVTALCCTDLLGPRVLTAHWPPPACPCPVPSGAVCPYNKIYTPPPPPPHSCFALPSFSPSLSPTMPLTPGRSASSAPSLVSPPPQPHIRRHQQIQHPQPLRLHDQLAQLCLLAAETASSPLLS